MTYRKGLSSKRRQEAHSTIFEKLRQMTKDYDSILSYCPLEHEVCLSSFNKKLCEEGRLSLPRIESTTLVPYRVTDMENQLKTFSHSYLEPDFSCTKTKKIDLVLVPGVVFDKNGGRIGFGKGFYDRFLKDKKIPSIGICYKEQIYDGELPLDNHDIAMEQLCII